MNSSPDLSRLFNPRSIAVVGASSDPTKLGFEAYNNLAVSKKMGSYKGELYPVNPHYAEVAGVTCYPDISSVKEDVDMALVVVPAQSTPGVMPDLAKKGVGAAILVSGGFSEVENAGLEEEVIKIARDHGRRVQGPNTLGLQDPHTAWTISSCLNGRPRPTSMKPSPPPGRGPARSCSSARPEGWERL